MRLCFFQAEDGIRGKLVTGVQTCALPIWFLDDTAAFWRAWVRNLGIPYEWQENIIRAAITLKLNAYEDTGAIVAAARTSIPDSRASSRNRDYRYCWLVDTDFVVSTVYTTNATGTMEGYLDYIN